MTNYHLPILCNLNDVDVTIQWDAINPNHRSPVEKEIAFTREKLAKGRRNSCSLCRAKRSNWKGNKLLLSSVSTRRTQRISFAACFRTAKSRKAARWTTRGSTHYWQDQKRIYPTHRSFLRFNHWFCPRAHSIPNELEMCCHRFKNFPTTESITSCSGKIVLNVPQRNWIKFEEREIECTQNELEIANDCLWKKWRKCARY